MQSESPRRLLFQAHLKPHRSLSRRHFRLMMGLVIVASLTISTFAWLAGAWPVFGFMGLDVALVYLVFRISYRRALVSERVELDEQALIVRRTDPKGRSSSWRLQPAWLKVELHEPILPQTPVVLRSHGKTLPIGVFLHPQQRREVARDLRSALDRWRRPIFE
ncbi:MAG TPA: DUF2244 domain-containing protein [Alphaproteobacteria bacterium]|nr:DUF2244 domain-containing protein [Alphaproteobacteria bacterium]